MRPPLLRVVLACLAAAVAGLALAGCGDSSTTPEDSGDAAGVPTTVRVIDPGDGDGHRLAYTFTRGETVKWHLWVTLDATKDGARIGFPRFVVYFHTTTAETDSTRTRIDLAVDRIAVGRGRRTATPADRALAALLAPARRIEGSVTLGPDGAVTASTIRVPSQLNPTVKITLAPLVDLSALITPLPSDPISVGARWMSAGTLSLGTTTVDRTTTYTLKSLDDDRFTLGARVSQTAEFGAQGTTGNAQSDGHLRIEGSLGELVRRRVTGSLHADMTVPDDGDTAQVSLEDAERLGKQPKKG